MSNFHTVKEAAALVKKHASSIRRIIYPIIKEPTHPDRDQVWPSIEEVTAFRMKGEPFPWKISEELLHRAVPPVTENTSRESVVRHAASSAEGELLAMLRRELDIKNGQIATQNELISKQVELVSGLSERLREGNHLIAVLQQRLALTDGREDKSATVVDATEAAPMKAEKSEKPEKGNAASPKVAKPKKGFFRFFS